MAQQTRVIKVRASTSIIQACTFIVALGILGLLFGAVASLAQLPLVVDHSGTCVQQEPAPEPEPRPQPPTDA